MEGWSCSFPLKVDSRCTTRYTQHKIILFIATIFTICRVSSIKKIIKEDARARAYQIMAGIMHALLNCNAIFTADFFLRSAPFRRRASSRSRFAIEPDFLRLSSLRKFREFPYERCDNQPGRCQVIISVMPTMAQNFRGIFISNSPSSFSFFMQFVSWDELFCTERDICFFKRKQFTRPRV